MKNPASRSRARQGRQVWPPTAGQRQATGRGAGTEGKRRHHAVVRVVTCSMTGPDASVRYGRLVMIMHQRSGNYARSPHRSWCALLSVDPWWWCWRGC